MLHTCHSPCYTGRFSVTRSGRLNLAQMTLKVPVSINCLNYDDSCTSGQDNTRDACVLECVVLSRAL